MSAPAPTPDETPAAEPGAPAPTPDRRSRLRLAVVAGIVVVALAAGVTGVVTFLGYRDTQAAAQAELDESVAAMELVRKDFGDWLVGAQYNVDDLVGRVEEEPRLALAAAVEHAESLDTTTPTDGTLAEQQAAVEQLRAQLEEAMQGIIDTTTVVAEAQYNWDLRIEQTTYDSALTGLGVAITSAEAALAAGTGTPEGLDAVSTALAAAVTTRDAERNFRDIDVVIAGAKDLTAARETLQAAVQALGA